MSESSVIKVFSTLGSNVYLVNSTPAVIIDTGHPLFADQTVKSLEQQSCFENLQYILCTHSHPDHYGATELIMKKTGAYHCAFGPVSNDKLTNPHKQELLLDITYPEINRVLKHNTTIDLDDDTIRVFHTPGHADDHCCYYFERRQLLFTGDLVVNEDIGFLNLNKPYTDSLADFYLSIEMCEKLNTRRVFPGHGAPYRIGPWNQCRRKIRLFEKNPKLLVSHSLIAPFIFFLTVKRNLTEEQCENYIADHKYLFDDFLPDITTDIILTEFRKLLSLLEVMGIISRNGSVISTKYSADVNLQVYR